MNQLATKLTLNIIKLDSDQTMPPAVELVEPESPYCCFYVSPMVYEIFFSGLTDAYGMQVRGVTASRGKGATQRQVLHGVDMTVPRGTLHMLVGPNGCGKVRNPHLNSAISQVIGEPAGCVQKFRAPSPCFIGYLCSLGAGGVRQEMPPPRRLSSEPFECVLSVGCGFSDYSRAALNIPYSMLFRIDLGVTA